MLGIFYWRHGCWSVSSFFLKSLFLYAITQCSGEGGVKSIASGPLPCHFSVLLRPQCRNSDVWNYSAYSVLWSYFPSLAISLGFSAFSELLCHHCNHQFFGSHEGPTSQWCPWHLSPPMNPPIHSAHFTHAFSLCNPTWHYWYKHTRTSIYSYSILNSM